MLCKTFVIFSSYKHFGGGATLTCFLPPLESSSWVDISSINSWKRHKALGHTTLLTLLFLTERRQWTLSGTAAFTAPLTQPMWTTRFNPAECCHLAPPPSSLLVIIRQSCPCCDTGSTTSIVFWHDMQPIFISPCLFYGSPTLAATQRLSVSTRSLWAVCCGFGASIVRFLPHHPFTKHRALLPQTKWSNV